MIAIPHRLAAMLIAVATLSGIVPAAGSDEFPQSVPLGLETIPAYFLPNHGQCDSSVRYLTVTRTYSLILGAKQIRLRLDDGPDRPPCDVGMTFPGAAFAGQPVGEAPLEGGTSYLLGNRPEFWYANLPHLGRVRFPDLYPGIDLVFHAREQRPEFDFIVAPLRDLRVIRMRFSGIDSTRIDSAGRLLLRHEGGRLILEAPHLFQWIDGERREVTGAFQMESDGTVGFSAGPYRRDLPLIIDPVLVYASYFGGGATDIIYDLALDRQGNIYVAGETVSRDLPLLHALQPQIGGGWGDGFIAKFDPSGTTLLYATYFGGSNSDHVGGIAVDDAGGIYVTGNTASTDFPVHNPLQPAFGGGYGTGDAYVARLTPAGDALVYATYLGGGSDEMGEDIAVDAAGSAHVVGGTWSSDFPVWNAYQPNSGGGLFGHDAFVTKLNASGTAMVYSTYLGGGGIDGDHAKGIALDPNGYACVTGYTGSSTFPVINALYPVYAGNSDAFVARLTPAGSPVFITFLGGSQRDEGRAVAADGGGIYLTGTTTSADFPTRFALRFKGADIFGNDAFITKLSLDGSSLVYSTYLSGDDSESGHAIAVDNAGNAVVAGYTYSRDFPIVAAVQSVYNGGIYPPYRSDAFVTLLRNDCSAWTYSTYLGGNQDDTAYGVAIDAAGTAVIAGQTRSNNDFPLENPFDGVHGGGLCDGFPCPDGFLARIRLQATGIDPPAAPEAFALLAPFPNPVNGTTTIAFTLPTPEEVDLRIYDSGGRMVAQLLETTLGAGRHDVRWPADGLTSGRYFCRLRAGGFMAVRPITIVK